MNTSEYLKFHESECKKLVEITKKKNHDYCAGSTSDPFKNFRACEELGICSVEQGFLTRMTDKMARINSFVKQGSLQVKDESVLDTLRDLANYSILLSGYIRSLKGKK